MSLPVERKVAIIKYLKKNRKVKIMILTLVIRQTFVGRELA